MLIGLGLLACGSARQHAALGWSLGGEAHVFVADDRFARDFYDRLSGSTHLGDSLAQRALIAVQPGSPKHRRAQVLSASGAIPATVTVARFHAPGRCGYEGFVTELVLAFPPTSGRAARNTAPPPHKPVVAFLTDATSKTSAGAVQPPLSRQNAATLLNRVVARAVADASLLRPLVLNPDQAADAGEIVPLGRSYGVGFRARALTNRDDTVLVTGVASTDQELRHLRWVIKPRHIRLTGGMIPDANAGVRYSLRSTVAGNGVFILVDEIADVSARDSRATVRSVESGELVATQPLALRCP